MREVQYYTEANRKYPNVLHVVLIVTMYYADAADTTENRLTKSK